MKFINPFKPKLSYPIENIPNGKIIYQSGRYKIVQRMPLFFDHIIGNIVVAQKCGPNVEMMMNLENKTPPVGEVEYYQEYERPMLAYKKGLKIRKSLQLSLVK